MAIKKGLICVSLNVILYTISGSCATLLRSLRGILQLSSCDGFKQMGSACIYQILSMYKLLGSVCS